jgi:SHS2 domain-containing protein
MRSISIDRLHAWGDMLEEAFEQCAMAMFGYMTEIDTVEICHREDIEADGHDMLSLLFHFLDECLFLFCADPFLIARVIIHFKVKKNYTQLF